MNTQGASGICTSGGGSPRTASSSSSKTGSAPSPARLSISHGAGANAATASRTTGSTSGEHNTPHTCAWLNT